MTAEIFHRFTDTELLELQAKIESETRLKVEAETLAQLKGILEVKPGIHTDFPFKQGFFAALAIVGIKADSLWRKTDVPAPRV